MFYAHSADDREHWEPLRFHLQCVADRASRYAAAFGAETEGRLAGLVHDLGKYSELFARRLEGRAKHLDHWSLGAWVALMHARQAGSAAALAVQGHHVGLQKGDLESLRDLDPGHLATRHPLALRLTESDPAALLRRFEADGLSLPELDQSLLRPADPALARMLDVRMLFSALVDADFVETEAHFEGQAHGERRYRPSGPELGADEALAVLDAHLAELPMKKRAAPTVMKLRADLLDACREAAARKPGRYTLTAPTGTGKTLAMLAFALTHAREHGLRRVVMAIPYLTIIEQTARVFGKILRPAFGEHYVLEHHSLSETGGKPARGDDEQDAVDPDRRLARQLAENWDAPLVITTNVQLLESLFSNRPSACRKLHRLAKSVILFDEVQTLPPRLAVPTLGALSQLVERYGSTVVFSTATQPAFDHLHGYVKEMAAGGWQPDEIVPRKLGLFKGARRTEVHWDVAEPISWNELADPLLAQDRVLCIVNLKRHAKELAQGLLDRGAEGLFHLSTNLCPAHRDTVMAEVRRRLDENEPCRLISTQCVEAGVDVDFPVVFRALGPLEAIAQAAGRCNRNGEMPGYGEVRVFRPEDEDYPPGGYRQATEVTRMMLDEPDRKAMDIHCPRLFRDYYQRLYGETKIADAGARELRKAIADLSFPTVAENYRLIPQDTINVVVPWDPEEVNRLRRLLAKAGGINRWWIREARPHAVSLFRPKRDAAVWNWLDPVPLRRRRGSQDGDSDDWFLYTGEDHYDRALLGLQEAPELWLG